MTAVLIVGLAIVGVYLGIRWHNANVEIAALRDQVTSLKRQISKRGRP